jgi:hypothetical protein
MEQWWGAAEDIEGSKLHAISNKSRVVHQVTTVPLALTFFGVIEMTY